MAIAAESLTLGAAIEFLKPATDFVRRGASHAGLTGERLGVVELVIEELFMNVANHAYPSSAKGCVDITWSVPKPGLLTIEITDQGTGFDPLSKEAPGLADSLDDRPIGGLGIFLVRQMTTSLEYRRDGGRNRLRFEISASSDD